MKKKIFLKISMALAVLVGGVSVKVEGSHGGGNGGKHKNQGGKHKNQGGWQSPSSGTAGVTVQSTQTGPNTIAVTATPPAPVPVLPEVQILQQAPQSTLVRRATA